MKNKNLVSRHAKKALRAFIEKEYDAGADAVWRKTIKQYEAFANEMPDYGGKKSPHAGQINDALILIAFCQTAPKQYTIEELEPLSFEIFMSAFHILGKVISAKRKWTMDLLGQVFKKSIKKFNAHAKTYPADFHGTILPYDKKLGVVKYSFDRCPIADFVKKNGLGKWLPLMCNCDHTALRKIHAGLIREGTCYTGEHCDFCIVPEDNPIMDQVELVRNEDGLLVSRRKNELRSNTCP